MKTSTPLLLVVAFAATAVCFAIALQLSKRWLTPWSLVMLIPAGLLAAAIALGARKKGARKKSAPLTPADELRALWPKIFAKIDKNNDGVVSKTELEAAVGGMPGSRIGGLFEYYADTNKDGKVTKTEWNMMYNNMLQDMSAATTEEETADIKKTIAELSKEYAHLGAR